MRSRSLWLVALAASCACTAASGLDDLVVDARGGSLDAGADAPQALTNPGEQPPRSDRADVTFVPAATPPAEVAADAGADAARPNLHSRGDIEGACVGWHPYRSTFAASTIAHGGVASCVVCSGDAADGVFTADDSGFLSKPPLAARYRAAAWVRAAPDAPGPARGVNLSFRMFERDPAWKQLKLEQGAKVLLDATWQRLEVDLVVDQLDKELSLHIGGSSEAGTCFLLDDVRVERLE